MLGKQNIHVQKIKLDLCLTSYTKFKSRWIENSNKRPETIRLPEQNIEEKLLDVSLVNDFLDMTAKAQITKAKIDKGYSIKLKSFCTAQETVTSLSFKYSTMNFRFSTSIYQYSSVCKLHFIFISVKTNFHCPRLSKDFHLYWTGLSIIITGKERTVKYLDGTQKKKKKKLQEKTLVWIFKRVFFCCWFSTIFKSVGKKITSGLSMILSKRELHKTFSLLANTAK